jgi:opacity protein-like surface antigen
MHLLYTVVCNPLKGEPVKRLVGIIGVIVISAHLTIALSILSAHAAEAYRKGPWEVILSPQYTLSKNVGFDGGTAAKINDTFGFGLQIGYNLNNHWNLAGLFSWRQPDYQAVLQPAAGTPGPARSISGTVQTSTFAFAVTYNFLAGPLTPYVDANVGGTYVNTDIAAGPPVTGCFWDPWFGTICGPVQPTKSDTFLTYAVGGVCDGTSTAISSCVEL